MNHPSTQEPERTASSAANAETRQARLIAGIGGGIFLTLILAFVSMVFFVQEEARLNAIGPIAAAPGAEQGGLVFRGTAHVWDVRGRMTLNNERQVRFTFELMGPSGQPPPASLNFNLALDMPGREMAAIPLNHSRTGLGRYVATTMLPEPGRWRLRMQFDEIAGVFEFDVDH